MQTRLSHQIGGWLIYIGVHCIWSKTPHSLHAKASILSPPDKLSGDNFQRIAAVDPFQCCHMAETVNPIFAGQQPPSAPAPSPASTSYPQYEVNLDLPPRQRWVHIASAFKESAHLLQAAYEQALEAEFGIFGAYSWTLLGCLCLGLSVLSPCSGVALVTRNSSLLAHTSLQGASQNS